MQPPECSLCFAVLPETLEVRPMGRLVACRKVHNRTTRHLICQPPEHNKQHTVRPHCKNGGRRTVIVLLSVSRSSLRESNQSPSISCNMSATRTMPWSMYLPHLRHRERLLLAYSVLKSYHTRRDALSPSSLDLNRRIIVVTRRVNGIEVGASTCVDRCWFLSKEQKKNNCTGTQKEKLASRVNPDARDKPATKGCTPIIMCESQLLACCRPINYILLFSFYKNA